MFIPTFRKASQLVQKFKSDLTTLVSTWKESKLNI